MSSTAIEQLLDSQMKAALRVWAGGQPEARARLPPRCRHVPSHPQDRQSNTHFRFRLTLGHGPMERRPAEQGNASQEDVRTEIRPISTNNNTLYVIHGSAPPSSSPCG